MDAQDRHGIYGDTVRLGYVFGISVCEHIRQGAQVRHCGLGSLLLTNAPHVHA